MVVVTPSKKARLWEWMQAGLPYAEMARKLNIQAESTVRKACQRLKSEGKQPDFYAKPNIPGRPRILTESDARYAQIAIAHGQAQNAVDLQRRLFPHVSPDTVRRALIRRGLHGRVRRKKPYLSPIHRRIRKHWAAHVAGWAPKQWRLCIMSDESKFNLFGSDGRQYCWRRPGEEFLDRNVKKVVKHGGGSIMVWGCITWNGTGRLCHVEGRLTAKKYCDILQEHLLGTLDDYKIGQRSFIYIQDNDPKHTSKLASKWFRRQNTIVLPWPSSSPDMNIIEYVWNYLDTQLRKCQRQPGNKEELWEALLDEWKKVPLEFIYKLYISMPRRVASLLTSNGGSTKY